MIRTDIDIKDYLYTYLAASDLGQMVSGKVYKDQRPLNSAKEDITIAVIARDADSQIQEATVNVNIYVPDIRRGGEAIGHTKRPRALYTSAASLLEYHRTFESIYELVSQSVEKAEGADWHIINNRIRARYSNEVVNEEHKY